MPFFAMGSELRGQSTTPRSNFVFHAYVHPEFGDDDQAMQHNPAGTATPTTPPGPLSLHPHVDQDPTSPTFGQRTITGYLQHAPYPFRTLSGANGALSYVRTRIGPLPSGSGPTITNVVIHCLPGLYGPRLQDPIDPVSGLPFNGEQFPIELDMERVSLQGTSALDTIFDARGQSTAILRVPATVVYSETLEQHQLVDGITFRNARASAEAAPGDGAAIWLRGVLASQLGAATTITNCVFQGNEVGIAIDVNAWDPSGPDLTFAKHRAIVFNNTFRWNAIGVWQGNLSTASPDPGVIASEVHSVFANNIFDIAPAPAGSGLPQPLSAFEGIQTMQREVELHGIAVVPFLDFNAFADGRQSANVPPTTFNIQATAGAFPVALPPGLPEALPRVDLLPFTPVQPGHVRTLFVSDALRNAPGAVPSDHDFRLSPNAGVAGLTGLPDPVAVHPCVDMGIDAGWPPSKDIRFRNGTKLCSGQLGLPSFAPPPSGACGQTVPIDDAEEAPISGWDCDAEGFGNRRITPVPPPEDSFGMIDIGADEMDALIVAGFVDGTRILTTAVIPNAGPGLDDHSRVYFFGRVGASMPRPVANTILGRKFGWYRHVQDGPGMTPPDRVVGSNFTDGAMFNGGSFTLRFAQLNWIPPANAYSGRRAFPRNLECDFSGTLVADPHPLWGVLFGLLPLWGGGYPVDGYASNPWFGSWNHEQSPSSVRLWNTWPSPWNDLLSDNQALYHNKGATASHQTWWSDEVPPYLPDETYVLAGHLNPPMTVPAPASGGSWLLQAYGVAPFGPFGTCSGSTLTFGSWCFNDTPVGCPDTIPEIPGESDLGRRFNLEPQVGAGDPRNLQTYLQIFPSQPPEGPMSSGGAMDFELARRAARELTERLEAGGQR